MSNDIYTCLSMVCNMAALTSFFFFFFFLLSQHSTVISQKAVFRLPDLEKKASKEKGVVSQSVKEVLQSLVDDELVDFDKIGSGNFYWALPSKGVQIVRMHSSLYLSRLCLSLSLSLELLNS
jgi:Mnd1 HTH domain